MANKNKIDSVFTDIANSIRAKKGTTNTIQPINMAEEIDGIPTGSSGSTLKKLLDATKSAKYLFNNYTGTSVDGFITYSDTENVTTMSYMFSGCTNLQSIPQLDTSNVTSMQNMFNSCNNLQTITQLDTSKVTNMSYMFNGCKNLQSVTQLDTSNVTDTSRMFADCSKLLIIPQLDTSKVTFIYQMFSGCKTIQTIPQLDTGKVTNMSSVFADCYNLKTIPPLNTNNVTDFNTCFVRCKLLTKIDLTSMDNVTSSSSTFGTFAECCSLTKLIIRTMTTIPVLNSNAFGSSYHFNGTVNPTYNPDGLKDGRIYVPDDKVDQLKQATNWSAYADIIVPLSTLEE